MSPFEVLYGKRCRVPISWDGLVDRITLGPELLKEMEETMIKIRQNLKHPKIAKRAMQTTRELIKSSRWEIMYISE
jgi:hypothetical protein